MANDGSSLPAAALADGLPFFGICYMPSMSVKTLQEQHDHCIQHKQRRVFGLRASVSVLVQSWLAQRGRTGTRPGHRAFLHGFVL